MSEPRYRCGKRLWSSEDDAQLRAIYPDLPSQQVAEQLGRSLSAINGRAGKLGLHKSAAYLSSAAACRLRRGDEVGKRYRFPKGNVPHNKGLRRPGWYRGRMRETQFKKGAPNSRTMPIGALRLIDGYVYRKISAVPHVAYTVNWRPEHALIWIAANGPIPPGHALAFKNRDRFDLRLENIECITRRELMARNTIHNLPAPLKKTVQLLGTLTRKINRRTRRQNEKQDRRSA